MLDYYTKVSGAYNKAAADIGLACRGARGSIDMDPKMALKDFLDDVTAKFGAVGIAVEGLSKLDYNATQPGSPERKKMMKEGEVALKAFKPILTSYTGVLDKALTGQLKNPRQPLKAAQPNIYRDLKLLKTELAAAGARAVQNWEAFDKQEESAKITADGKKKTDKIADDNERKQAAAVANAKAALLTISPKLKAAIAKGAVAVQKIKADPTAATYNTEMNNAGRDVSQNLVNIRKWRSHPEIIKIKAVRDMPDPGPLAAAIAEFGDGNKRSVAPTATAAQVQQLIKEYSTVIKSIADTYSDVLNGKLASKLAV